MFTDKKVPEERVIDNASLEVLNKAEKDGVQTVFHRMDTQQNQCQFGKNGICCRICYMGPCRITSKSPKGSVNSPVPKNCLCCHPSTSL